MSKKTEIQAKINELEEQLAILNTAPEDTFNIGTVVLFSATGNKKWYRTKTGEETWRNIANNSEKSLAEWILEAIDSNTGYFEVYELRVQNSPFYTSA